MDSWGRRLDLRESSIAWHAFVHFRDLPAGTRSLDRAYTFHRLLCSRALTVPGAPAAGVTPELPARLLPASSSWRHWRTVFHWDARAADRDVVADQAAAAALLDAIAEMNRRYAAIARAVTGKVVDRLQTFNAADLSPGQLIMWLKEASGIERLARGVPTAIVGTTHGATLPPDFSNLDDGELLQLERLLEKAHGTGDGP